VDELQQNREAHFAISDWEPAERFPISPKPASINIVAELIPGDSWVRASFRLFAGMAAFGRNKSLNISN
jgi:hypothetical protein